MARFYGFAAASEHEPRWDDDEFGAPSIHDNPRAIRDRPLERIILQVSKLGHLPNNLLRHACCALPIHG